jgi:2-haloacid dehalogenase
MEQDRLEAQTMNSPRYDAVLFDLLTGLLDSWSLWNEVAGDAESGRRWRSEYLNITYRTGAYRPYETLVAEAALDVGLNAALGQQLSARYGDLRPWPGVVETLAALRADGIRLGVVTNCSERLGRIAAANVGVELDTIVTAEAAGYYKPHERPYRMGMSALGAGPGRCLFVAGSAFDLVGTAKVGLSTFWHDRTGMNLPPDTPPPLLRSRTIEPLVEFVAGPGE